MAAHHKQAGPVACQGGDWEGIIWDDLRERRDERQEKYGKEKHVADVYSRPGCDKRDGKHVFMGYIQ